MEKLTDDEIIAAANDWKAWGRQFGWTLRGIGDSFHSERGCASFTRDADAHALPFSVVRAMRDDIDAAIKSNQ